VNVQVPPDFKACWTAVAVQEVICDAALAGAAPKMSPPATRGRAPMVVTRMRWGQPDSRVLASFMVDLPLSVLDADGDGVIDVERPIDDGERPTSLV
jgi:hypothetical protein